MQVRPEQQERPAQENLSASAALTAGVAEQSAPLGSWIEMHVPAGSLGTPPEHDAGAEVGIARAIACAATWPSLCVNVPVPAAPTCTSPRTTG